MASKVALNDSQVSKVRAVLQSIRDGVDSDQDVADLTGIRQQTVNRILRGVARPGHQTARLLHERGYLLLDRLMRGDEDVTCVEQRFLSADDVNRLRDLVEEMAILLGQR